MRSGVLDDCAGQAHGSCEAVSRQRAYSIPASGAACTQVPQLRTKCVLPLPNWPCRSGPSGVQQSGNLPAFSWVALGADGQALSGDGGSFECSVKTQGQRGGKGDTWLCWAHVGPLRAAQCCPLPSLSACFACHYCRPSLVAMYQPKRLTRQQPAAGAAHHSRAPGGQHSRELLGCVNRPAHFVRDLPPALILNARHLGLRRPHQPYCAKRRVWRTGPGLLQNAADRPVWSR